MASTETHDTPGLFRRVMESEHGFLALVLIVLVVGLGLATDRFLTGSNAVAILHQSSLVLIVAVGMTLLLITAEVDISVGASLAFASCIVMATINATGSIALGALAGVAFGAGIGLINALVTTVLRVNSLIGTIAMMMMLNGGVYLFTREAVQNHHQLPLFPKIATGFIAGIPVPVLIAAVVAAVGWIALSRTRIGRLFLATGANPRATRLSGYSPERFKTVAFVVTGALVGLAAVVLASLLNAGQPTAGQGFELTVIAAVLLGGTSLMGGRGTVLGTILAVLILKVIDNGIILLRWNQDLQIIVPGIVLILALYMDQRKRGHHAG
ncbi:ABC transporter permease [Oceaniglobus trochenteri]|uniref:ABC transporter permease n=1 Tax=Oceaniglobus trochenteri TaxID=2763260 RepID=UPI001CFF8486|nr:ABC transporter permease [Oceaniglobus trochenteri]